ncbi:hypothetical protein SAMN00017477_1703 [Peptoniphilus asaccharolyticus DSM 20463]|uniref:Uncharacterized protein n=1 Tax=Peptoniphilus asaccharolyticus DSM 20463 TaxID=573058 RepID=A0A1W1VBV6_PEPAS|nr:hypothetical protein [Peptoniphilus asaccharolyticus]MBL7575642.1 hypothetical protein [Peptoniphilus asaccharolyticus]SMB90838.1 hypothetical protein SAMN00017477_1703 [Peptoniphilus asaccharolyticus DSM 20463]
MLKKLLLKGAKKAVVNKVTGKKSLFPTKRLAKIAYLGTKIKARNKFGKYM